MKQIFQSLKTGETTLEDVPIPKARRGEILIRSEHTLVSAGTERMLVSFGKAGWVSKARQQPDKVRMVLEKAKTDGVAATLNAVRSKLDQPLLLGYCNVGHVREVGADVEGFDKGDRVVSNGNHAEYVSIPKNLCAKVPENVSSEAASFTVLGAIGLQGIRLLKPTLGECIVVTGLGLIGLMTVQMLRAHGCRVLGIDFDAERLALARQFGAETINPADGGNVLEAARAFSRGRGVDGVILTASTESNEPVHQAAEMCRKRGRIVLVGVVGLNLSRADFYEKELSFQVSCSYGPGRYDPDYEDRGHDYPIGYVRWTEQRNFEAVLDLMASGALDMAPLISHRFEIDEAEQAMGLLTAKETSLGILINYPQDSVQDETNHRSVTLGQSQTKSTSGNVAFIGAGNYAGRVLIPAFKSAGAKLTTVVSSGGVSAVHFGKKYGFETASTDFDAVLADDEIDTIVIATRHDAHASQVLKALKAGKHVFCEKPLCLTLDDYKMIEAQAKAVPDQLLMIGFNRRFSPHIMQVKALLDPIAAPKTFVMTVNAGDIPSDHWTQDIQIGGGRIMGEACHFIDLLRDLAGAEIVDHNGFYMGEHHAIDVHTDKAMITLKFADGSIGSINYLANGHKAIVKERLEIFSSGRALKLDNFRKLEGFGWPNFKPKKLWKQDKGQTICVANFMEAVRNGTPAPIPVEEVLEVSRVTIDIANTLK